MPVRSPEPATGGADGLSARVEALFAHDLSRFVPFRVAGTAYGWVRPEFAARLAAFRDVFDVGADGVSLRDDLREAGERTIAVGEVVRMLQRSGDVPEQEPEPYPLVTAFGEEPALLVDRVIVAYLGVKAFGVHLNGYVAANGAGRGVGNGSAGAGALGLWVARRSPTRRDHPGKLDHLVAGGQPAGLTLEQNLAKESAEEADLPEHLVRQAVPVGTLSYRREVRQGLRNDTLFLYDLALPADFEPHNRDGEVESFALWPASRALSSLRETDDWKYNVAPVVLDFLVRRGVVPPDEPAWTRLRGARSAL